MYTKIQHHKCTLSSFLSLHTCPELSLYFPDLTFCSTCSLCLGTYLPIKCPSTLHEWMPFSVMWIHRSPDGRGGKQPWQLLDISLIDFEWCSLTEETLYSTTSSQKPEDWRCLLIKKSYPIFWARDAYSRWTKIRVDSQALPFPDGCFHLWSPMGELSPKYLLNASSHHLHCIWVPPTLPQPLPS